VELVKLDREKLGQATLLTSVEQVLGSNLGQGTGPAIVIGVFVVLLSRAREIPGLEPEISL
jgi:anti-sigma-K factor RskA